MKIIAEIVEGVHLSPKWSGESDCDMCVIEGTPLEDKFCGNCSIGTYYRLDHVEVLNEDTGRYLKLKPEAIQQEG